MTDEQGRLFAAVDALVAEVVDCALPTPGERRRLREAAGLSQEQVAQALSTRRETVASWENGRSEPRAPRRAAYARLLANLAERHPGEGPGADGEADGEADVQEPGHRIGHRIGTGTPSGDGAGSDAEGETESGSAGPRRIVVPVDAEVSERDAGADGVGRAPDPSPVGGPDAGSGGETGSDGGGDGAGGGAGGRASAVGVRGGGARKAATRARKPAARPRAARATRFVRPPGPACENGPFAVVTGTGKAHTTAGVLPCPDTDLPALVTWALDEAGLGAPRLADHGHDADPLVVLTADALPALGLPASLSDRRGLRLAEDHPVHTVLRAAGWRLTGRGFGPWARVYRSAEGGTRRCVQFAVLPWGAFDARAWGGDLSTWEPEALTEVLGAYATRVLTPLGSTAVTGLELMSALRPPTRPVRDGAGGWRSAPVPGSLTEVVECAPPEAPDGHPLAVGLYPRFHRRTPAEVLDEEACQWARPLTDEECLRPYVVGVDVNMAFAAAANGLVVGTGAPVHVKEPVFDPKLPGSWLVDLSEPDFGPLLPNPYTPDGRRPEGPAWYATPTLAYAVSLGHRVEPIEAYVRPEHGTYLTPWYQRLRDAYLATMAELGVVPGMPEEEFLAAMARHKEVDPGRAMVLSAIKATVKGGIGKLREGPRGAGWRPGEPWPALSRVTWRPDIRAAVISAARVNMHRKVMALAGTGRFPVAILSDCAVYASDGPAPTDFLPRGPEGGPLPGGFRLGVSPGMVKHEGTRTTLWAEGLSEEHGAGVNIARYVKGGDAVAEGE
ncbi:telomere-associated protein Tap (plasmid) [Streptomyces sp. BI20]|uniref:telomere-associated protein Tap n=1 Tax=Streptomyces sp. BI20 TaxID=3403460 RepID=UPI003C77382F